jgi:hypothetical protein
MVTKLNIYIKIYSDVYYKCYNNIYVTTKMCILLSFLHLGWIIIFFVLQSFLMKAASSF